MLRRADIKFVLVHGANVSRVFSRKVCDKRERHKVGVDTVRYCFLDHIATAFA